jgi:hypothetical protein
MNIQGSPPSRPLAVLLFPNRIGRLAYLARVLSLVAIHLGITYALLHLPLDYRLRFLLMAAWVLVMMLYFFGFVVVPRLRHFGLPPLAVILCFVPFVNALVLAALLLGPEGCWQRFRSQAQ